MNTQILSRKLLLILLMALVMVIISIPVPAHADGGPPPPEGEVETHTYSQGETPKKGAIGQEALNYQGNPPIGCDSWSAKTVIDSDSVFFYSTTSCTGDMLELEVTSHLQRRRGVWPIHWWETVSTASTDACVLCDFAWSTNTAHSLIQGVYRVWGYHEETAPPGYQPPGWTGNTYSLEFNLP